MTFKITYTAQAQQDLQSIHTYIHDVLLEPETAKKQLRRIIDTVKSLNQMPFRHTLYDHEPWYSLGFRVVPADNFLIFYLPNEDDGTVSIARVIYGGRNIPAQLETTE